MKSFIIAVLFAFSINSFAEGAKCHLDLSDTDLSDSELELVQPVLQTKNFVDNQLAENKYIVGTITENENMLFCTIKLSVINSSTGNQIQQIEKTKFTSIDGDKCSLALVAAIQSIRPCQELIGLSNKSK